MKILMINSVCGIRSTGRICTDIADELTKLGHECKIAYGRESVPEKHRKYAIRIGSNFGTKLHGLKSRIFDACGFGSTLATKKFIKWVETYDPDVIHLHNLHGYYINIRILFNYLARAGKPVIWTLHDCWAFTGHCAHFVSANCEKWKTECHSCPKKKHYPSSILLDNSRKNYNLKKSLMQGVKNLTVVTPSKWLSDLAQQSFLSGANHVVIPNGINLDVFKPTESNFRERYGLENKRIVLGVASAWHKGKGLYDMMEIAKRLPDDYRVVMVGLTEEQLGLIPSNITAITRTNNTEELAAIYTAADVFVNPTYADTYPTVNLEAQACGTPVITYRTGGSVESVPADNVVEQGDIGAMCDTVKRTCESGTKHMHIKNDEDFSSTTSCLSYIDLYDDTVSIKNNHS